jgi:transposase
VKKLYHVTLTEEEVQILDDIVNRGKHTAQKRKRAQALLLANSGKKDRIISEMTGLNQRSVEDLRQRFVEDGFETTLKGKPRRPRNRVLDGRAEAHLAALVCSEKPEGCARRTIRPLRDRMVADLEFEGLGLETVRMTLKKTKLNLGSG